MTDKQVHYDDGEWSRTLVSEPTPGVPKTRWTYDSDTDLWYFHLNAKAESDRPVVRTLDLGKRAVVIDYDDLGNVIGVEVI